MSLTGGSKFILTGGATNYQIARSLRFRSDAPAYLTRTYSAAPTTKTKCTISAWVKLCAFGTSRVLFDCYDGSSHNQTIFRFNTSDQLEFDIGGASDLPIVTTAVFRDPSAWLHIVCVLDTTLGSSRVKFWVNGASQAVTGTGPGSSAAHQLTSANASNKVGSTYNGNGNYFNGYMAEFLFIDGQALDQTYFGQTNATTGAWNPIAYTGTYGTNGFYLPFSDNSAATSTTIGKDSSGNGNNWTPTNISVTAGVTNDSLVDVPTNYGSDTGAGGDVRGNFWTLSPINKLTGTVGTIADGNLKGTPTASALVAASTPLPTTGKWFWTASVDAAYAVIGIATAANVGAGSGNNSAGIYANGANGTWFCGNANGTSANAFNTSGDISVHAIDMDAGKYWIGRYRSSTLTWIGGGDPAAGTSPTLSKSGAGGVYATTLDMTQTWFPYAEGGGTVNCNFNFGQRAWDMTCPSGYKALCTQNLPDPAIAKPSSYFDVALLTGTGAAANFPQAVQSPDLYFLKDRSGVSNWQIGDTSRTNGSNLHSNSTAAEVSNPSAYFSGTTIGMQPYDADGGTPAHNYVGYQWKKGALPGFDIVSYTGNGSNRTISHALGVAPKLVIVKNRTTAARSWTIWHTAFAGTDGIQFDTAAKFTDATVWNSTTPTSSVFSVGTHIYTNTNTDNYIAYCFAEVAGFSKFGSYTGNGSTDGPFVWCGFRPRFIMIKDTTGSGHDWFTLDTARDTYNAMSGRLFPNSSGAESPTAVIDATSNGFKLRATDLNINASSNIMVFAAFAESPFKTARARCLVSVLGMQRL